MSIIPTPFKVTTSAVVSGNLTVYGTISASTAVYANGVLLGSGSSTGGLYLPLSGGQLTGPVTSLSSLSAQGTLTGLNIATNNQIQFLTGGNFVKAYQFYNSTTNSIDTVFN